MPIRNPKDFWSGLLFLGVGGAVVLLARNYQLGSALKMGPGYFPTALGGLLAVVGLIAVARSFIRPGTAIEPFHWRLLLIVLGATLLFGVLVRNAGLIAAVAVLVLTAAAASVYFRWRVAIALAVGLVIFSVIVFVKALGLPMPLIGPWLGG
ncbi:MAG TPA: tripartite tricarboxylate transporter TctB family protein [Acidiferrobacterales bacterium]|nr:tripartite tricarboxylate transporter TctB family protein [Acidiferrobacterales bacterium]